MQPISLIANQPKRLKSDSSIHYNLQPITSLPFMCSPLPGSTSRASRASRLPIRARATIVVHRPPPRGINIWPAPDIFHFFFFFVKLTLLGLTVLKNPVAYRAALHCTLWRRTGISRPQGVCPVQFLLASPSFYFLTALFFPSCSSGLIFFFTVWFASCGPMEKK
jgi:hypothetical protein